MFEEWIDVYLIIIPHFGQRLRIVHEGEKDASCANDGGEKQMHLLAAAAAAAAMHMD